MFMFGMLTPQTQHWLIIDTCKYFALFAIYFTLWMVVTIYMISMFKLLQLFVLYASTPPTLWILLPHYDFFFTLRLRIMLLRLSLRDKVIIFFCEVSQKIQESARHSVRFLTDSYCSIKDFILENFASIVFTIVIPLLAIQYSYFTFIVYELLFIVAYLLNRHWLRQYDYEQIIAYRRMMARDQFLFELERQRLRNRCMQPRLRTMQFSEKNFRVQSGEEESDYENHFASSLFGEDFSDAGLERDADDIRFSNVKMFNVMKRLIYKRVKASNPIDPNIDYVVKLLEDIFIFLSVLSPPTNRIVDENDFKTRIIKATAIFIKLRNNTSLIKFAFGPMKSFILNLFEGSSSVEVQSGIEDYLGQLRGSLETVKNVSNSPIFNKIYRCCMYLMCTSVFEKAGLTFDKVGYTKLEEVALKKKFYKKSDFVYTLADTLLFILERGYQVYKTGDVATIFHSGGTYKALFEKSLDLKRRFHLLNNPEEHGFTECEYRNELDNTIEKLESVNKHAISLDKTDRDCIRSLLNDLIMVRDDINTQSAARKERKAPFSVLLCGDSGIGKTTLTSIIRTYFAKFKKLPEGSEYVYTRNPAAKYWDGFRTSCHTIILDDIANEDPTMKVMDSVNEVIQLINNCAFCPDQAALETKGRTPMKAELVIGTTNVKTLNCYHYFSVPSAVQRRFPYIITPTVKEQYKDERGMLSSEKTDPEDVYPDLWNFKIEIVKPVSIGLGKRLAELEVIHEDLNMKQFLAFLRDAIIKFDTNQTKVKKNVEKLASIQLCMTCCLPDNHCECQVQSGFSKSEQLVMFAFLPSLFFSMFCYVRDSYPFLMLKYYICWILYCRRKKVEWIAFKYHFSNKFNTPERWNYMGKKMLRQMKHPLLFLSLISAVSAVYLLYRRYKKLVPQTSIDDIGTRPVSELNTRENVWYNNDIDLSPANFSRESSSSKSIDFSEFCKKISDNVIHMSIHVDGTTNARTGKALCLGGHVYITTNHNIPKLNDSKCRIIAGPSKGLNSNMEVILSEADVTRLPDLDLAFIIFRELQPKKKIIQYIQLGESNGVFNGKYVSRNKDGSITYRDVRNIRLSCVQHLHFPTYDIKMKNRLWSGLVSDYTTDGVCGSPLIIQSTFGYSIVGLHFLAQISAPSNVHAAFINKDILIEYYNKFSDFNVESGCLDMLSAPSAERSLTILHGKSPLRYIPTGNVTIYGSFVGFRGKHKTSVCDTPMQKYLDPFDYPVNFTKPVMQSWVPWSIALKELVNPIHTLSTDKLNKCTDSYIETILSRVTPGHIEKMLHPLDDFSTINGAEVTYIDKLNRKTSAGNPWKKSKKYFLKSIEPQHGMLDPVEVDDEIMDRVRVMEKTYRTGSMVYPNFCAHLKDEPVSFKKAETGKTRVFTGAPFDWIIVVRKYLLSVARLIQNNRTAFEAGPGTVAQSLEWHELYNYIVTHGEDRIVAGDYKAFDKKMSPKEILAAFDIMSHLCKLSGNYTDDDLRVIRGIAEDTAFAMVDYNGDLIQLFGSNPSGNPLTVILNSIVNSLRMRYVYLLLSPDQLCNDFQNNVALMTYGDDNIMSVSRGCNWFNHTSIADCFAKLDIVYTMADKEAKSIPFIHIKDASFLKRTWRMDDDLKCYMAPLDHESIERMLTVWTRSKAVTEEAQGIDVISTALREYFFYGREVFLKKRKMLQDLVRDLKWNIWVQESTFPTYEQLCEQFINSSKRCSIFDQFFADYKT